MVRSAEIRFQRPSGFEYCIQQRKKTCLLSIQKSFSCARASKLTKQTYMYELTQMCWNWRLVIPDGLSVAQCRLGHIIGNVFFWHSFCGTKRTCWTTGSWRCCLCLGVLSSIPVRSTMIYRFLCGFIYAFPCTRASKSNRQICICIHTLNMHVAGWTMARQWRVQFL